MSSTRERAPALAADAGKPAPLARVSEWLMFVKAYALKNNISYKQALKDASPSYKTRNETIVEPEVKATIETSKPKRKYNKKDKSNI